MSVPDDCEIQGLWRSMRNDALRRGADHATAEDVAQEAWLAALKKPPEDRGRFPGWLRAVTRRLLRDMRRSRSARFDRERSVARMEGVGADDGEARTLLEKHLSALPPTLGTVVRMRFLEERDVEEIATALQLHPEAVRSRLKRGLAMLRARLEGRSRDRDGWAVLLLGRLGRLLRRHGLRAELVVGVAVIAVLVWRFGAPSTGEPGAHAGDAVDAARNPAVAVVSPEAAMASAARTTAPAEAAPVVVVEPQRAPGTRVAGVVRTPHGDPLPGALVRTSDSYGAASTGEVIADAYGRFELEVPPTGWIWASAEGWLEGEHCLIPTFSDTGAVELSVSPTRGAVRVRALDHARVPVPGATVLVGPDDADVQRVNARAVLALPASPRSATTDAEGWAEILFPDQGSATVIAFSAQGPFSWSRRITPRLGDSITVKLSQPAHLEGLCWGENGAPAAGIAILVQQHAGRVRRETITDAEGRFRVEGLGAEKYLVHAVGDAGLGLQAAVLDGMLEPDRRNAIELRLSDDWTLQGSVTRGGLPVPGLRVAMLPKIVDVSGDGSRAWALTDAEGRFRFLPAPQVHSVVQAVLDDGTGPAVIGNPIRGEVRIELPEEHEPLEPLELEFVGDAEELPQVIHLDLWSGLGPFLNLLAEPGGGPGVRWFRSPPLVAGTYHVLAWSPGIGLWNAGVVEHVPLRPHVHRLMAPRPGRLVVRAELPDGITHGQVRVAALRSGLRMNDSVPPVSRTALAWDPLRRAFLGSLAPGAYVLSVTGDEVAELMTEITVAEDRESVHDVLVSRGVAVRLILRGERFLRSEEVVHLTMVTPRGSSTSVLRPPNSQQFTYGHAFEVHVPVDVTELHALTGSIVGRPRLEGRTTVRPGELEDDRALPRIIMELRSRK